MEIALGLVFGAAIGAALHYALPRRGQRGAALGPLLGAVIAGLAWLALTWAGAGAATPWPWLASVVLPALGVWAVLAGLTRARTARDARERARLGIV
ncbi:hypothetical protein [Microbacterium sp. No. 7]|uniref:hypothetical protein n=1 Tax=Microbacterium sp. No. 7 TaxID=1714373 RepID=UPI0006CFE6A1|nr:hypothetical protein [Microbacterium sp. No. 7]ALJ19960.1 hypothetical protein AOA12_08580 [Microbacterium sp. No. 7]